MDDCYTSKLSPGLPRFMTITMNDLFGRLICAYIGLCRASQSGFGICRRRTWPFRDYQLPSDADLMPLLSEVESFAGNLTSMVGAVAPLLTSSGTATIGTLLSNANNLHTTPFVNETRSVIAETEPVRYRGP